MKKIKEIKDLSNELQYWKGRDPNNILIKNIKDKKVKELKKKINKINKNEK